MLQFEIHNLINIYAKLIQIFKIIYIVFPAREGGNKKGGVNSNIKSFTSQFLVETFWNFWRTSKNNPPEMAVQL